METLEGNLSRVTEKPGLKQLEAEKTLLRFASFDSGLAQQIKEKLSTADFKTAEAKALVELIFATDLGHSGSPAHFLLDNLPDEAARQFLAQLLVKEEDLLAERTGTIINDCIAVLLQNRQQHRVDELKSSLRAAEDTGDHEQALELLNLLKSEIS